MQTLISSPLRSTQEVFVLDYIAVCQSHRVGGSWAARGCKLETILERLLVTLQRCDLDEDCCHVKDVLDSPPVKLGVAASVG